jgi:hypothetical protein
MAGKKRGFAFRPSDSRVQMKAAGCSKWSGGISTAHATPPVLRWAAMTTFSRRIGFRSKDGYTSAGRNGWAMNDADDAG